MMRKLLIGLALCASLTAFCSAADRESSTISKPEIRALNSKGFEAYEKGNVALALRFYKLAALQGDGSALYNVAAMRIRDEVKSPSIKTALQYLEKSAASGFAPAQFMLASLLETGEFVGRKRRSLEQSAVLHTLAAEQGHPDSAMAVGTAYFLGRGVVQDYAKALVYYLKSADAGDAAAQYLVASMYESGTGAQRDLEAALQWYVAAARQGDVAAREKSKLLAEAIAKERIAKEQQL